MSTELKPIAELDGRELDREIAELMGWEWVPGATMKCRGLASPENCPLIEDTYLWQMAGRLPESELMALPVAADWARELPHFSTDIRAAMWLLDEVRSGEEYDLYFGKGDHLCIIDIDRGTDISYSATTRELAIARCCLAVLRERAGE